MSTPAATRKRLFQKFRMFNVWIPWYDKLLERNQALRENVSYLNIQ